MPTYGKANLSADPRLDGRFDDYVTRDHLPNEPDALRILRRCARIVFPIMRNHGWSLFSLREIAPGQNTSSDLLGELQGYERNGALEPLYIDLCRHERYQPDKFRSMTSIIQTLLHGLAHIYTEKDGEHDEHGLDFWVRAVGLLIELEEAVDRGEVEQAEVPTRMTLEWESREVYKLVMEASGDPRVRLVLPENSLWPEPHSVRCYSQTGTSRYVILTKPNRVQSFLSFLRGWRR